MCYESRKLKEHEKNYATHDLELPTIVHVLTMWKHYLMERMFFFKLDNVSLKYLFDQQNLNVTQARWMDFLKKIDFEIKHIKGKENRVVDMLSRKVNQICTTLISIYQTKLEDRVRTTTIDDEKYQEMKIKIQNNNIGREDLDFSLKKEGVLIFKNRLYRTNSVKLKLLILNEFHKRPFLSHPSYFKMIMTLRKYYY